MTTAFVPASVSPSVLLRQEQGNHQSSFPSTSTSLFAIGVLAKKAKEAELRKYVEDGVEDNVMEYYQKIKAHDGQDLDTATVGPLQQALTRRHGTITVIAEYKRKMENSGFIDEIFDPEILSPTFREFGASGIAVLADNRMGGCDYKDIQQFAKEQKRAKTEVPGPVGVINNDLVVDELQIARTAASGGSAVVLDLELLGPEKLETFMKAAQAVEIESIVAVSSKEDAQKVIDLGARIVSIVNLDSTDELAAAIDGLQVPEGEQVCTIAVPKPYNDKALQEVEDAWVCRDKGFNCVWVGDALYKSGNEATEHPGAIIKSMTAKSSVKWASAKARTGKGEGAREYLGDILM